MLANRSSTEGLKVARHYLTQRNIPAGNLIQLDLPDDETISRQVYEEQVLRPVRQALVSRKLTAKIRIIVTTYGMPLRISAPVPQSNDERWRKDAEERRKFAEAYLERAVEALARIAPAGKGGTEPSSSADPSGTAGLSSRLDQATRAAIARLNSVSDPKQAEQWKAELARIMRAVGGSAILIRNMTPNPTADRTQAEAQLNVLKQQVMWSQQAIQTLMAAPTNEGRERAYKLSERVFGLTGIMRFAGEEIATYSQKDADASLDSELSLLWWDLDFYRLAGRLNNPLYYGNRPQERSAATAVPIIMVSRLDGSTPDIARQLVDKALAAERDGLSGKVYVDSRGTKPEPNAYALYDQSLRDMANLIKSKTNYPVVLEDTERRFSQSGEASDTALYAGWYKLRSYEDAFTFRPGAIGYHLASAEAISLHDPTEPGWCKNALDHGITITMGSTDEPYLDSFPLPQEFFGLLLSGRYSLVEAYYVTSRYVSWRMVLIGDPLYNPWKKKEQITEGAITWQPGADGQPAKPTLPTNLAFPDPVESARTFRKQRQEFLAEIDRVVNEAEKQEEQRKKGK